MKKLFIFFLIVIKLLFLVSCKKDKEQLLIMVPSGTPSLIIASSINNQPKVNNQLKNYRLKYEIVNGSDPLIAAFTSKSHDIIFAPTNLGANIYNKNPNYIFLGVAVWGNNYIISNIDQNIKSIDDLSGKKILGFGKMSTPDAVLQIVLSHNKLIDSVNVDYVLDVATATSYFLNKIEPIIMTAEPLLSKTILQQEVSVIDLQTEWEKITGFNGYPQVGIFVKQEHLNNPKLLKSYMELINQEINFMNTDVVNYSKIAVAADESFAAIGEAAIAKSIPNCNYRLEYANNVKEEIIHYFMTLLDFNPNLIGGKMPNEEFYWNLEKT